VLIVQRSFSCFAVIWITCSRIAAS